MALLQTIEDQNTGIEFTYWKLGNVILFHNKKSCKIEILGYLNRDKYKSDPNKFIARQYNCINSPAIGELEAVNNYDIYFSPEILNAENMSPQKQAYLFLKTLPDFYGSFDEDL